ncbi:mucin-3A-like isoform X2 [Physella acuta]|uniref:mucin-3A-like isoform X2 n=1 Tax=Physella acuta TaxID=109671 RepID=UPI0027DCE1BC|nr:mucin-3A-like isoform X2 [Physella acuta]
MDTHGDYSPLDRSRLLASGLDNGAGGSGGSNGPGGGSVHPTVSELAGRAATPTAALSTLAAQYHSRFGLPPAMPDFPRYLMTSGLYPSYPPLFPGEPLSLLGSGMPGTSGPSHPAAHYQRLLELQKDAYLASMSAASAHHPGLYINPPGLAPYLDQVPSTTPLSLVKQEPKESSEKSSKVQERRSSGFKVDLDSGRPSSGSQATLLREPKLSPSLATSGNKKSSSSSQLKKSNSVTSVGSNPRHQLEASSRAKCTSPASNTSSPAPSRSSNIANGNSRKNRNTKPTKTVTEPPHGGGPAPETPVPEAAPIPLASLQHDGLVLSALASPSSAAASAATSKPAQQHAATPVSDSKNSSGVPYPDTDHSEDNSDIVVDSTENDEVTRAETTTKSETDAVAETIEHVASHAEADRDTPRATTTTSHHQQAVTSSAVHPRPEAPCAATTCVPTSGTRTVYAKTQPVPSVTASGTPGSVSSTITTQTTASALPYYHTLYSKPQGVKKVHATTFVPEVGVFRGPTFKVIHKNSTPLPAVGPADDRNRTEIRPASDGRHRSRDCTPSPYLLSPSRELTNTCSPANTAVEISSSLDTASLDSASVRSPVGRQRPFRTR